MNDRRAFFRQSLSTLTAVAGSAALGLSHASARAAEPRRPGGSQRRWRVALGLNGFMSSEGTFGGTYPLWEVLDFGQREGFEGVELCEGWPKGMYPDPDDESRIASLRGLFARYNLKIFSIQTFGAGAFGADPAARVAWLKQFAGYARFAHRVGCECIGYWPGGELGGQSIDAALDNLVGSLKEAAKIVAEEQLLLSVEIEPPFAFNTLDHLIRIIDGVDHPLVRAQYDSSHFDLFGGGMGKPEELLQRLGVERLGYVHLTDSDGTLFHGTSKHLPCGEGHIDIRKSLELLGRGGYEGWIMIDTWMTENPYHASRKGLQAVAAAQRELFKAGR